MEMAVDAILKEAGAWDVRNAELQLARLTEKVHNATEGFGTNAEAIEWARRQVEGHEFWYMSRDLAEAMVAAQMLYMPLMKKLEKAGVRGEPEKNKMAEDLLFSQATVDMYNAQAGASKGSNPRGYLLSRVREQAGGY